MKNWILFFFLVIGLSVHAQTTKKGGEKWVTKNANDTLYFSESLEIYQVAPNTWVHVSYLETESFGRVPCNGMIAIQQKECYVFDTPANETASIELISFLAKEKIKVIGVIATHFHNDCLAGFETFEKNGIPTMASEKTNRLVREKTPDMHEALIPLEVPTKLRLGTSTIDLFYPGEGHTQDNIVVFFRVDASLFGGCLIKEMNASKGYLGDANEITWSQSVSKVKNEFPNAQKVIPGHGKVGGRELLDYTEKLFLLK